MQGRQARLRHGAGGPTMAAHPLPVGARLARRGRHAAHAERHGLVRLPLLDDGEHAVGPALRAPLRGVLCRRPFRAVHARRRTLPLPPVHLEPRGTLGRRGRGRGLGLAERRDITRGGPHRASPGVLHQQTHGDSRARRRADVRRCRALLAQGPPVPPYARRGRALWHQADGGRRPHAGRGRHRPGVAQGVPEPHRRPAVLRRQHAAGRDLLRGHDLCMICRAMGKPTPALFNAALRILYYLHHHRSIGLRYGAAEFEVNGMSDSDCARSHRRGQRSLAYGVR
eukprot:5171706-Prymnesium_polylepis.1